MQVWDAEEGMRVFEAGKRGSRIDDTGVYVGVEADVDVRRRAGGWGEE